MPGCDLVTALSGPEGIQKALAERPDVILLDIRMPGMDGFETCSRLAADADTGRIPVIMVTATKTDPESRIKGLSCGANAFVSKPIDPAELVSQIRVALRIKKAEDELRHERDSLDEKVRLKTADLLKEIRERKQLDEERDVSMRLLRLLHERNDLRQLMQDVTALLQERLDCEAVGIRLRSGEDFPYFETRGFPPQFIEKENRLCACDPEGQLRRDGTGHPLLEGMCGNILCGRFDPAKPFFTPHGSFWTNGTTAFLATTTEADRQSHTRNRCNQAGYESMALIPLRNAEQTFGLLQINDHRPNRFTLEKISLCERLADSMAIALSQKQAQEALRQSEGLYRSLFANMLNGFAYCRMLFENGQPRDFVYLTVNDAFESLTGLKDVIGKRVTEVIPNIGKLDAGLLDIYGRVALTGKPERFEWHLLSMDMWFSISVYSPAREHFVALFDVITARKKAEIRLNETLQSLRNSVRTTIQVVTSAVEARDPYTAGHQTRAANLTRAIATEMGLTPEQIDTIRMASAVHDIGKLSVPSELLSKPTKLSADEFSLIKEHARQGYEILKDVESSPLLAEIVHQHHERMDGSGYPRRLKGEEIMPQARILAVADVVESMASHRPYRPALGIEAALAEIELNRGRLYDEAVVDACLRLFREKGFQFDRPLAS
jgi:response regulator RpfG family c-di-GMP phosphodiesterase